jgi:predicted outer membrane repeat protein
LTSNSKLEHSEDRIFSILWRDIIMRKYYFAVLFFLLYLSAGATILHVPENYSTINDAIDIILCGDTILVQPGTYVENLAIENKTFTLASLYLTTADTSYVSTTIIDGGENDCVIRITDTIDTTSVICGFTVTGGRQSGVYPSNGGGIYCRNADIFLSHLVIENNYAGLEDGSTCSGGGIYCRTSDLRLDHVIIRNNHVPFGSGGGIYSNSSQLEMTNMLITGNLAESYFNDSEGGAICLALYSSISMSNCLISNNIADYGGGLSFGAESYGEINNVTLEYNTANRDGGAINCTSSSPEFTGLTICNNTAAFGGGIMCFEGASPSLYEVNVIDNTALSGGGLCCMAESSPSLVNVLLTGNASTHESSGGGGLLIWGSSFPYLANVTFFGNTACDTGGAILCGNNANPVMLNCLLWNDIPQEIACRADFYPNSITIAYCDIQDGEDSILTEENCAINWLDGNIDSDPLLLVDFSLSEFSPCRDAGIAWYEYNDEVLIYLPQEEYYGAYPDMGAYEYFYVENIDTDIEKPDVGITCYPNPFNPTTNISYELAENCQVKLDIYNIKGQIVASLLNEWQTAGKHKLLWNGEDEKNRNASSGIYFCHLQTSSNSLTAKMILLK